MDWIYTVGNFREFYRNFTEMSSITLREESVCGKKFCGLCVFCPNPQTLSSLKVTKQVSKQAKVFNLFQY